MHNRLLDSVILIDHFNNVPESTEFLMGLYPEQTAISVVTRAEILVGVEEDDKDKVIAFLDQYAVLPIDKNIAEELLNRGIYKVLEKPVNLAQIKNIIHDIFKNIS